MLTCHDRTHSTYHTYYTYIYRKGEGHKIKGRTKGVASTTWAKNRAKDKYRKAHYRNVCIVMKEAERDALKAAAAHVQESMSTYAKKAIADRIATGK